MRLYWPIRITITLLASLVFTANNGAHAAAKDKGLASLSPDSSWFVKAYNRKGQAYDPTAPEGQKMVSYQSYVNIFHVPSRKLVKSIWFSSPLDDVFIGPASRLLFTRQGKKYTAYAMANGGELWQTEADIFEQLPGGLYLLWDKNKSSELKIISAKDGAVKESYQITDPAFGKAPMRILPEGERYLLVKPDGQAGNHYFIIDRKNKGKTHSYTNMPCMAGVPGTERFNALYLAPDSFCLVQFTPGQEGFHKQISGDKILKRASDWMKEYDGRSGAMNRGQFTPYTQLNDKLNKLSISPNAQYFTLPLYGQNQSYQALSSNVIVFDFEQEKIVLNYQQNNLLQYANSTNGFQEWQNDTTLLVGAANQGVVISLYGAQYSSQQFSYNAINRRGAPPVVGPNHEMVVTQTMDVMAISSSLKSNVDYRLRDFWFGGFGPEGRLIYYNAQDDRTGFLFTGQLRDMRFNDDVTEYTFRSRPPSVIAPESMLSDGPNSGFRYFRMNQVRNFDSQPAGDSLFMVFHTLEIDYNTYKFNLQLFDKEGNYYSGACNTPDGKDWCVKVFDHDHGNEKVIEEIEIQEKKASQSMPYSIALVLDFSGSMGQERANALRQGAVKLFKIKRPEDQMFVIGYDNEVGIETQPSDDSQELAGSLLMDGIERYGGATAMLDAIEAAIRQLEEMDSDGEAIIILFTDGYDNASNLSLEEAIGMALDQGVKINTVGYGNRINQAKLMALAYNTYGAYYRIFKQENLSWILEDMYRKSLNYYTLEFDVPASDIYEARIELCNKTASNSISLAVNSRLGGGGGSSIGLPVVASDASADYTDQADTAGYGLTGYVDGKLDKMAQNEFRSIDFPNIKFVTDKTEIVPGTDVGLEEVALFMEKYPEVHIEITGHTDVRGSEQYNLELSEKRAEKVKSIIVDQGIAAQRISTRGAGEGEQTQQGLQADRRVEFRITRFR